MLRKRQPSPQSPQRHATIGKRRRLLSLLMCLLASVLLIVGCTTEEPKPCGGECQTGYTCVDNQYCVKAQACSDGQTSCSDTCVDLTKSAEHCGKCDNKCGGGQYCQDGACKETPKCDAATSACGDKCIDLKNDGSHCGKCDNACGKGEVCIDGSCISECPSGQQSCGDTCVDLQASNEHCGTCGNKCEGELTCTSGKCACPNNTAECNGSCVDTDTDKNNCGTCGNTCATGQACSGGSCKCSSGTSLCGGKCVDTNADKQHCGACGNLCNDNETCDKGSCIVDTCVGSQIKCDGKCLDVQSNTEHCGTCNNKCGSDMACQAGQCTCNGGKTQCSGSCIDTSSDRFHCGACGNKCTDGKICVAGRCACAAGSLTCDGACTDVQSSNDHCGACGNKCPSDKTCSQGVCGCPQGQTLCSGKCVDTQTDTDNCGACDTQCSGTAICMAGACSCPSNTKLCDATCADVQTNTQHCGQCSNLCRSDQICTGGACTCDATKTACNGTCVDTQGDDNNCGGCGKACGNGTACINGSCTCQAPYTTCGTSCVNLQNNASHCGQCGTACGTGEVCSRGTCKLKWGHAIDGSYEIAKHVTTDAAGNAYTTGTLRITGNPFGITNAPSKIDGAFVVKTLKSGTHAWVATLPNPSSYAQALAVSSSGNVYVTGYFQGTITVAGTTVKNVGYYDIFVAKLDATGSWKWIKQIGGPGYDVAYSIAVDSSENVYVGATFTNSMTLGGKKYLASGNVDNIIVKYDKLGALQATAHLVTTGDKDAINALHIDSSDGLFVGGSLSGNLSYGQTQIIGQGGGGFIIKFDTSLTTQWFTQLSSGQSVAVKGIQTTSSGDIYAAGHFNGIIAWGSATPIGTSGGNDVFLAKLSSTGAVTWIKAYGGSDGQECAGFGIDSQGNLLVAGHFSNQITLGTQSAKSKGYNDLFVASFSDAGAFQWMNAGGTTGREYAWGFSVSGDDFYLAGTMGAKPSFATASWAGNGGLFVARNLP